MSNFLKLGREWIDTDEVARIRLIDTADFQVPNDVKSMVVVSFKQDSKSIEIRLDELPDAVEATISRHFARATEATIAAMARRAERRANR